MASRITNGISRTVVRKANSQRTRCRLLPRKAPSATSQLAGNMSKLDKSKLVNPPSPLNAR
jgi:hypothetical protein